MKRTGKVRMCFVFFVTDHLLILGICKNNSFCLNRILHLTCSWYIYTALLIAFHSSDGLSKLHPFVRILWASPPPGGLAVRAWDQIRSSVTVPFRLCFYIPPDFLVSASTSCTLYVWVSSDLLVYLSSLPGLSRAIFHRILPVRSLKRPLSIPSGEK